MEVRVEKREEITIVGPLSVTEKADSETIKMLWENLETCEKEIELKVPGVGYELHLEEENKLHYCLTGLEVEKVRNLPLNCFAKTLPQGDYAVFSIQIGQIGFSEAYKNINRWLEENAPEGAEAHKKFEIQVYDSGFKGMDNPESTIDFLIPLF